MFDPTRSQLLSSHSLYISLNEAAVTQFWLSRSLVGALPNSDTFLYFYVGCGTHYASVQIQIASFRLHEYPEQFFPFLSARYRFCCPSERQPQHEDIIRKTSQAIYNSSVPTLPWNFLSPRYWLEEIPVNLTSQSNAKSCFELAVDQIEDYISQPISSNWRFNELKALLHSTSNNDATNPRHSNDLKGQDGTERIAEPKNLETKIDSSPKSVQKFIQTFQIDLSKLDPSRFSGHFKLLSRRNGQDSAAFALALCKHVFNCSSILQEQFRVSRHLSVCYFLIWMKLDTSLGTNEKSASQKINTEMNNAGFVGQSGNLKRIRDQAKLVNQIVATLCSSQAFNVNDVYQAIFRDSTFHYISAYCRMPIDGRNEVLSQILALRKDQEGQEGSEERVSQRESEVEGGDEREESQDIPGSVTAADFMDILCRSLPDLRNEIIFEAIGFQPVQHSHRNDSQDLIESVDSTDTSASRSKRQGEASSKAPKRHRSVDTRENNDKEILAEFQDPFTTTALINQSGYFQVEQGSGTTSNMVTIDVDETAPHANVLSPSFPCSPPKTPLHKKATGVHELGSNAHTDTSPIPEVGLDPGFNNILSDYSLGTDPGFNDILSSLGNDALPEFTLGADPGFNNILLQRGSWDCGFDLLSSFTGASDAPTYASQLDPYGQ